MQNSNFSLHKLSPFRSLVIIASFATTLTLSGCGNSSGSKPMNTGDTKLTATQTDHYIKSVKAEIQKLLPKGAELDVAPDGTDTPTALGVQCDLNDTSPNAPTKYNYDYEVHGHVSNKQFPGIANTIFQHFTKKADWKVDDKASPSDWDLRSNQNYLLSLVISPKGNLLSITLSTPCVPKTDRTFTP